MMDVASFEAFSLALKGLHVPRFYLKVNRFKLLSSLLTLRILRSQRLFFFYSSIREDKMFSLVLNLLLLMVARLAIYLAS